MILKKLGFDRDTAESIIEEVTHLEQAETNFLNTVTAHAVQLLPHGEQAPTTYENLRNLAPVGGEVEHSEKAPTLIAEYEDIGKLGQGGMGSVRLVRDRKLNRNLAMKIIHPEILTRPLAKARFIEEAQICAQLQHPNIVPIHDFGVLPDGRYYFTMKEVKGRSLDKIITSVHKNVKDGRFNPCSEGWGFRRLVEIFYQVCQAVSYAHSRGVLHRDLKPSNVMVGEFGEVLVLDWGIAKIVGRENLSTETESFEPVATTRDNRYKTQIGQVTGTLSYMAPEQARGEINLLSPQTDIYALGVMLCKILTNTVPYLNSDTNNPLRERQTRPPEKVSVLLDSMRTKVNQVVDLAHLPSDLIVACEKAMSYEQSGRFDSVNHFALLISEWLIGTKKKEQALNIVNETIGIIDKIKTLREVSADLNRSATEGLKNVSPMAGEDLKLDFWAMQDASTAKALEADRLHHDVERLLQAALMQKPDLVEAHKALTLHYLNSHQNAEFNRESESIYQNESRLRDHVSALPKSDVLRSRVLHYLKGTGALTLTTDVEDVDVYLDAFVTHGRRLVPKRIGHLGNQRLKEYPLAMGTYRIVLKKNGHQDVIYPVHIARGAHWRTTDETGVERPIHVPVNGELLNGECFVPAGKFWCGGDAQATNAFSRRDVWVDDIAMSTFPVTNRDYLLFLNSLIANGQEEAALRFAPQKTGSRLGESGSIYYARKSDGLFDVGVDAEGDLWELDWPVMMVDFDSAEAYCRWKSEVSGKNYRLPDEFEWEKAAKGVDGRWYVWGDGFDPSYCHSKESPSSLPVGVDSFAFDKSVYGIRGLAGNVIEWTSTPYRENWDSTENNGFLALRGGCRHYGWVSARASRRYSCHFKMRKDSIGFRLVRDL